MKKASQLMYLFLTMAFALAILPVSKLMAQQPTPQTPVNFTAKAVDQNGMTYVELTWQSNPNPPSPMDYVIYMAEGFVNDPNLFKPYGFVKHSDSLTSYMFPVYKLRPDKYSFFVTARLNNLQSPPSNIEQVSFEEKPYTIISPTQITLNQGQPIMLPINVFTNINCIYKMDMTGQLPTGLVFENQKHVITGITNDLGDFTVTVTVSFDNCTNVAPVTQDIKISVVKYVEKPYVRIVSQPPPDMFSKKIGETLLYQTKAETNVNCPISYGFIEAPKEATIDMTTGLMTWTPTADGIYVFGIIAEVAGCQNVQDSLYDIQYFKIMVGNGGNPNEPCATISGWITSKNGDSLNVGRALVQAYKVDTQSNSKISMFTMLVLGNQFTMRVPEGEYVLYISGDLIEPTWYDGATDMKSATRIPVKCGETANVNILVNTLKAPNMYKVTGKVVAESDNSPIFAMVEFIPVLNVGNNNNNTKPNVATFATKTDQNGMYSIMLPDNNTYKAHAISAMNSIQYMDQYYDKAPSSLEADLIVLEGDLDNVDFYLTSPKKFQNSVKGNVTSDSNMPLKAQVIALLVTPSNPGTPVNTKFSQSVQTDVNGAFEFKNLIPGDYVFLSSPNDRNFVPGYYVNGTVVTLKWKEATHITITDQPQTQSYTCIHRQKKEKSGILQIGGNVRDKSGITSSKKNTPLSDANVNGAMVYLIDENGSVVDDLFTDNKGNFVFNQIDAGTYKLIVDKVGFEPTEITVQTDFAEKSNQSLTIDLVQTTTGVDDLTPLVVANAVVIPSPADNNAMLNFNSTEGNVTIDIVNYLGAKISSINAQTISGLNSVQLPVNQLSSGLYFAVMKINGKVTTVSFVVSK